MEEFSKVEPMLKNWGKEYKKGFSGYFILLLLKERPMYGFQINKQLLEITGGKITFQESGIYQILKRLEKKGMVASTWQDSEKGPRRKYYQIKEAGNILLKMFTQDYILPIIQTATGMVKTHFPNL